MPGHPQGLQVCRLEDRPRGQDAAQDHLETRQPPAVLQRLRPERGGHPLRAGLRGERLQARRRLRRAGDVPVSRRVLG